MKVKRVHQGWLRLWTTAFVLWWVVGGWIAYEAHSSSDGWQALASEIREEKNALLENEMTRLPSGEWGFRVKAGMEARYRQMQGEFDNAISRMRSHQDTYETVRDFVLPAPLVLLCAQLLGLWIFRGFRREARHPAGRA